MIVRSDIPVSRFLAAVLVAWTFGTAPALAQSQPQPAAQPQPQRQPQAPLPPRPDPKSVPRPTPARIKVTGVKIHGADQLGAGRVKSILGTRDSSWLPWGRKRYFDRAVFDADLGRIEAYYVDRGYPDAKVTGFDAMLNELKEARRISVRVHEGGQLIVGV